MLASLDVASMAICPIGARANGETCAMLAVVTIVCGILGNGTPGHIADTCRPAACGGKAETGNEALDILGLEHQGVTHHARHKPPTAGGGGVGGYVCQLFCLEPCLLALPMNC